MSRLFLIRGVSSLNRIAHRHPGSKQRRDSTEKSRVSSHVNSLLHGLFTVSVAMEENAHAVLWTNQMGYITLIAQLPGILWQRKPPLSLGYALGLGSVYCHKFRTTGQ